MHALELNNVSSGYNGQIVLHDISFKLQEPSIYVVLGPNGAGKTTLFRTIAGILEPYSGRVLLDDQNITTSGKARTRMSYLSQYNAMPEEMTVFNALRFFADMEGGNPDEVIDLLDLGQLKDKRFSDLSQGQKKRAALAKVFLHESDLYLLDEPTANLDPSISKEIRDIITKISKDKMVLYSSHNLYEATDIGTYLILIKNGSITMLDRISNIKPKNYRVGIKTRDDISKIVDAKHEGDYYVLSVSSPEEAGLALKKIVEKGILVTEMRQLDNPLQDLFETPSIEKAQQGTKNAE
ncbi:MAG TPA: ABC transporter ATP-binding protein [Candidatus Bathyarchaeia archaeon]|nr:ABC transporter ATP-binding protein [Candidatus Bathyarchaeia archaeon]